MLRVMQSHHHQHVISHPHLVDHQTLPSLYHQLRLKLLRSPSLLHTVRPCCFQPRPSSTIPTTVGLSTAHRMYVL